MFTIILLVVAGLLLLTIVYMLTTARSERGASHRDGSHLGAPYIAMDSSHASSAEQSGRDTGHQAGGWGDSGSGAGSYEGGWGDSGSGGDGGGGDGGGGGGE